MSAPSQLIIQLRDVALPVETQLLSTNPDCCMLRSNQGEGVVDPPILEAWLAARSVARGLPLPIPDRGGFRIDTNSVDEVARWVFPDITPGLGKLGRSLTKPGYLLKLCGTPELLKSILPIGWQLHTPAYFMTACRPPGLFPLPAGYTVTTARSGEVVNAKILFKDGRVVASGYAAEASGVFVYDRIMTEADHRRKGLGRVVMGALHEAGHCERQQQYLVATDEGRALYSSLGWETISLYSTASIGFLPWDFRT